MLLSMKKENYLKVKASLIYYQTSKTTFPLSSEGKEG